MLLFYFAAAPRADVSKYLEAFRTSCFIVKYVSGKFPGNGLLMLSGYKKTSSQRRGVSSFKRAPHLPEKICRN